MSPRGYATFAGGGKLAEPYTILEIRRPNGDIIYDRAKFAKPQKQVVPEEKIAELNSMLKEVVKHGTGAQGRSSALRRRAARPEPTRPTATPGTSASRRIT